MIGMLLLVTVTMLYAGYNLFIKVSGSHVPADVTSTILATICLQLAALGTSSAFAALLLARGGQILQLPSNAHLWAAAAGGPHRRHRDRKAALAFCEVDDEAPWPTRGHRH